MSGEMRSWAGRLLMVAALAGLVGPAVAETMLWNNPAGGSWHAATNWDPENVPNAGGEEAVIPDSGYACAIDLGANTSLDRVTILNPDATVNLADHDFSFYQPEGLTNHGTVSINPGSSQITGNINNQAGGVFQLLDGTVFYPANCMWHNDGRIIVNPQLDPAGGVILFYNGQELNGSGELILQTDGIGSAANIETYYTTEEERYTGRWSTTGPCGPIARASRSTS